MKALKRYFKTEDYIVFTVSFISLIWICLYQLYWCTECSEPLFKNAYEWGVITFTILTSVVASGLFYVFTIFIPRAFSIQRMIDDLKPVIDNIDSTSIIIVSKIQKKNTNTFYSEKDFLLECEKDIDKVEEDFAKYYQKVSDYQYFIDLISYQLEDFKYILSIYSFLLPKNILRNITSLTTSNYYSLKMKPRDNSGYYEKQFFFVLHMVIIANTQLRNHLK